jgi:hypothetical protein
MDDAIRHAAACQATDERLVEDMTEYLNTFIDRRFVQGVTPELRLILAEVISDAFHDGAIWCENQLTKSEGSPIITEDRQIVLPFSASQ